MIMLSLVERTCLCIHASVSNRSRNAVPACQLSIVEQNLLRWRHMPGAQYSVQGSARVFIPLGAQSRKHDPFVPTVPASCSEELAINSAPSGPLTPPAGAASDGPGSEGTALACAAARPPDRHSGAQKPPARQRASVATGPGASTDACMGVYGIESVAGVKSDSSHSNAHMHNCGTATM